MCYQEFSKLEKWVFKNIEILYKDKELRTLFDGKDINRGDREPYIHSHSGTSGCMKEMYN